MDYSEEVERLEKCEHEAASLFKIATKPALAAHTRAIVDLEPYHGSPRWTRERDKADRQYQKISKPAWELYKRSVNELMMSGEISEQLDAEWTALRDSQTTIKRETAA